MAAQPEDRRARRRVGGARRVRPPPGRQSTYCAAAGVLMLVVLRATPAAAQPSETAADAPAEHESKTEINKNVADPVSTTWSLKVKNTVSFLDFEGHGDRAQYKLQFQPTMPVLLTPDLKLIVRPEFTFLDDKPYANSQGELQRTTGVGDTILDLPLSPVSDPWLLGLGPTFVFPTANLDQTGNGKWQAGPIGVAGYRSKTWLAGFIAQQWWSFAGAPSRAAVSELNLQYIANYFFADGWSVGTSPTMQIDWRAAAGNQVTFPIGPTVAKVVKVGGTIPVQFQLEGNYVPVHPDPHGERFVIQVTITPVIPSLLRGPLFGGQG